MYEINLISTDLVGSKWPTKGLQHQYKAVSVDPEEKKIPYLESAHRVHPPFLHQGTRVALSDRK